jgi:hypothetical protein
MNTSVEALIEAAVRLADCSIPLVLLQHGLKAPIKGADGSWVVVADPDAVAEVIQGVARHGLPNIGAVLAPKCDSPLVVVDIDGAGGWRRARELGVSSGGSAWISKTGRGNFHVYYHWDSIEPPPPRKVRAGTLPIDLLSDGYAVVAPSNTYREAKGGGPYRWVKGHSPRDISLTELDSLPGALLTWWRDLVTRRSDSAAAHPLDILDNHPRSPGVWSLLKDSIADGQRNDTLTRIAGWLKLYHPPHVVEALLLVVNEARCEPPLSDQEVSRIVQSVSRYPQHGVNGHPKALVNPWRGQDK